LQVFILVFCVIVTITSCTKEDLKEIEHTSINLSSKVLSIDELNLIDIKIKETIEKKEKGYISNKFAEEEIKEALQPLVENGKILHAELTSQIDLSNPNYGLTKEDIDFINNFDEKQLAELSFAYSSAYAGKADGTVRACLAVVVGVAGLYI